jgi:hypothetical protein
MFPKKRIIESKASKNNTIKKPRMTKSISLIINTSQITRNNISKRLNSNIAKKSNSVDKPSKKHSKLNNNNNKNKNSSKLYNITLQRQNSQGVLYTLKNFINDTQISHINQNYHRINSHLLSETKTPKLIEMLNNKIKNKKNYLETYSNNNNSNKANNSNKSKASLSLVHKKRNTSQGNMDYINFDEYYNYNIFKGSRNQKLFKKLSKENHQEYNNKMHKSKYDRYDKNKCIIERKIYGGERQTKKNDGEKIIEIKTLPNSCESLYNKILFNNIKLNINKELHLNNLKKSENNNKININVGKKNNIFSNNNNISSYKLLNKSKTNNILNTSLEDLTQSNNNNIQNTNININNNKKDIKLIFPPLNKCDLNNDSSQESTNQIGNTFSNKLTINSNIGYRKEKFISSFLDGPEDIHYRFVDLHRQRKMFYENLCNKLEDEGNNIDNKVNINDFEKNEYSEYFDNYNEKVPLI